MNIQCGLILHNLETELNCCKMNVQCGLFFKGNKLHQSWVKLKVFSSVSLYTGILCMGGWNWGDCRGDCRHTIPHPQVVAWGN